MVMAAVFRVKLSESDDLTVDYEEIIVSGNANSAVLTAGDRYPAARVVHLEELHPIAYLDNDLAGVS